MVGGDDESGPHRADLGPPKTNILPKIVEYAKVCPVEADSPCDISFSVKDLLPCLLTGDQ